MLQLKAARQQAGLNQSDLAKCVGVSRSTIAMWESGGSQPDIDMVLRLSRVLDVSVGELVGEKGSTEADKAAKHILGREEKKTEQPTEYDGLSEKQKTLIDFAKSVPEEKAEMILRVMKTIVEGDQ